MKVAAIVLTKNEERDLPDCLKSLQGLASEVFVIDSGSTDRTCEIAREHGTELLTHEFINYAKQFNWALANINSDAEWILRIDADERLSPELQAEMRARLDAAPPDVTGFAVARLTRFLGRTIRWGDTYPVWLLRVWRNGVGRCEDAWMDEHIVVEHGRVEQLNGDLVHEIPKTLNEWVSKHNWYASRECEDIVDYDPAEDEALAGQARVKRWLKRSVYLKSPPFFRAFGYWCYRYFIRLGFLDGKAGLIYHFLQGFWYRFLVDAKLHEKSCGGMSCNKSKSI